MQDEPVKKPPILFPAQSLPRPSPIATKQGLLLIDFTNDFISQSGHLFVLNTLQFIHRIPSLADIFRSKGDVIWIKTEHQNSKSLQTLENGFPGIINRESRKDDNEAFLSARSQHMHPTCRPGTAGVRYPEFLNQSIDLVRDVSLVKNHYSAFADTDLLTILRTQMISSILICGSMSNISVYATTMDAVSHGIGVTLIEDCLGYHENKVHVEAMRHMKDHMGAHTISYQRLIDDLNRSLARTRGDDSMYLRSVRPSSSNVLDRSSIRPLPSHMQQPSSRSMLKATNEQDGKLSIRPENTATQKYESSCTVKTRPCSSRPSSSPSFERKRVRVEDNEHEEIVKRFNSPVNNLSQTRTSGGSSGFSSTYLPNQSDGLSNSLARLSTSSPQLGSISRTSQDNALFMADPTVRVDSDKTNTPPQDIEPTLSGTQRQKKLKPSIPLKPDDVIGNGDSRLKNDIMSTKEADKVFDILKTSVKWQKMYHRTGEVPRLVAVQGKTNGSDVPIYRHPADESPELNAFDDQVDQLRQIAERFVGHELNHVLIQWYRNGEDNISEHSDKTLDIVRGSSIVNLSLGAQRTMTLRTKKSLYEDQSSSRPSDENIRQSQRIPLPHNSLFVLGQRTNQSWLHSIRADKRPAPEKSPEELAFGGERISLTFRQIGTFIDIRNNTIWGQGATSKTKAEAKKLLDGPEAERVGEEMIRAFGQENHRSKDWNWDEWYGRGFDVVNFVTRA